MEYLHVESLDHGLNCLRRCATSLKVAGWIHDEVIEFFNLSNTSSRTLGFSEPLTELSTRIYF
jgi:hypothetical protein